MGFDWLILISAATLCVIVVLYLLIGLVFAVKTCCEYLCCIHTREEVPIDIVDKPEVVIIIGPDNSIALGIK